MARDSVSSSCWRAGCWWEGGGRCYAGDQERESDGKSKKHADVVCDNFKTKRAVLERFFKPETLTIISEENRKLDKE
jgi:hypothetical protein